jgi:hypothetical protein
MSTMIDATPSTKTQHGQEGGPMNDIDELDRLHAAATAGPRRMVFAVRAYDAWPGVSARLRAAEVDAHNLRAMLGRALDEHTAAKAEVERLRWALALALGEP